MRIGLVVVVCGLLGLVGCSGGSSGGSGKTQTQSPTANVGGPYAGTAGTAVSFSAAGSADPQGQALTYSWNFGDLAMGTGANPTHTYAIAGTYTVTLTVTDTSGLTGTSLSKATIAAAVLPDAALTGIVTSGPQAVVGAHVYLLAANTTGYGGAGIAASSSNASVSVLSAAATGASDALGAYATTGPTGGFSLTGDYTCVSGQQLYLYALGGNTGIGVNAAVGMMAALGSCPSVGGPATYAVVNEVSTVATAYALAGFATDATHVGSSGTALALTGIRNAFANAGNLETLSTGVALATTPAGNGTVPLTEINTLGNILASCVNASAGCSTLLSTATADGTATGSVPTDTATAAINMAHHPGANVAALYGVAEANPSAAPGLAVQPNDFTVGIITPTNCRGSFALGGVAVDSSGSAWFATACNSVTELSSLNAFLSPRTGWPVTLPSYQQLEGIAIDGSGIVWLTSYGLFGPPGSTLEMSSSGVLLSGANGLTPGFVYDPQAVAIDGLGNVWVEGRVGIAEFSDTGVVLPGTQGPLNGYQADGIAIDGAGNAWVSQDSTASVGKFSGSGANLSGTNFYTGGGLSGPKHIAVDASGSAWIANSGALPTVPAVIKVSNDGSFLSGAGGFTGSSIQAPYDVAIDGSGNAWVADYGGLVELSNSGTVLLHASKTTFGYPIRIAIDGSGDVWGNYFAGYFAEFIGVATPVITPIAAGLPSTPTVDGSSKLGTRP